MSKAPISSERYALTDDDVDRAATIARRAGTVAIEQTRAIGFWSAVALPFLYVPVLATGLETVTETGIVLVLLALNLLAILAGRGYNAD